MLAVLKILIAASVIALASWFSGKKPELAGFIIALPLASILALLFSYAEHQDTSATITFAKSIMVGVPVSYLFFVPFFLAERWQLSFWSCFASGLLLLVVGYFLHQAVMGLIARF